MPYRYVVVVAGLLCTTSFVTEVASRYYGLFPSYPGRIPRCCDYENLARYSKHVSGELVYQTTHNDDNDVDDSESELPNGMRPFKIQEPWDKKHLTYCVKSYSSKLTKEEVDDTLRDAFDTWTKVSQLTFERKSDSETVDIEISFENLENRLGQAHYPRNGGSIQFSDDVNWVIGYYQGIDFFQVAVHEIGHAIGISHSKIPTAVMYKPYRHEVSYNFKLDPDDIEAVQSLYGKPEREPEPPDEPTEPDSDSSEVPPPPDADSPEEPEPPRRDPEPPEEPRWRYPAPRVDPRWGYPRQPNDPRWWWWQGGWRWGYPLPPVEPRQPDPDPDNESTYHDADSTEVHSQPDPDSTEGSTYHDAGSSEEPPQPDPDSPEVHPQPDPDSTEGSTYHYGGSSDESPQPDPGSPEVHPQPDPDSTEGSIHPDAGSSEEPPQHDPSPPYEPLPPDYPPFDPSPPRHPSNQNLGYACFQPVVNSEGQLITYFYEYDTRKYAPYYLGNNDEWIPYFQHPMYD